MNTFPSGRVVEHRERHRLRSLMANADGDLVTDGGRGLEVDEGHIRLAAIAQLQSDGFPDGSDGLYRDVAAGLNRRAGRGGRGGVALDVQDPARDRLNLPPP